MKARRSRRVLLIVLACGVILLVAGVATARRLGAWLIVADPLVRSDVIFVTDGGTPLREAEAAILYREGWAPRVAIALPRDRVPEELHRLTGHQPQQEITAAVLQRAGVPAAAVVRLDRVVDNTHEELQVAFDYARAHGFRQVIIVSSPYHTRRIRLIWSSRYRRDVMAIVRATRYEPVEPSRWWRSRRSLEDVLHEVFGIAHFFIGSPIPTFDRGDRGDRGS